MRRSTSLNVLDVLERALFIQAAGHGQNFGVVGDGDVLVSAQQSPPRPFR